jgi:hypothetical protein
MNATQTQHGSGNWVAFLFGAIFNMIVSISYQGLTEYALYSLVGSMIAGGVWLVYKIIADRLGVNGKKEKDLLDKLIDKQKQNGAK